MPQAEKETGELLELAKRLKERAEKALSISHQEAGEEVVTKARAVTRARHEFSTADVDDDDREWSTAPTSVKSAIHELTVKRKPDTEAIKRFHDLNDALIVQAALFSTITERKRPTPEHFIGFRDFAEYQRLGRYLLNTEYKAAGLSTGAANQGVEFVPTNFSSQLIDKWRLQLLVPGLFQRITMPTKSYKLPLEGADSIGFLIPEATDDRLYDNTNNPFIDASHPQTANITFTAVKLATRTVWSDEVTEDSIINMIEFTRNKIAQALANADEDADLNGDTTGPHMDGDITDARDRRKAWIGLRKSTNAGAKVDFLNVDTDWEAKLRSVRVKMGKYGVRPSQLAWIIAPSTYSKIMANCPNVQTIDKYGGQATILTGELARFDGIPIIVSEFVRENLNDTGVKSGGITDRTVITLVNHTQFMHGDRSLMTLRSYEHSVTDQLFAIAKHRLDFKTVEGSATNNVVALGINVKTT